MINLILFILIIVLLFILTINGREKFSQCKGVTINRIPSSKSNDEFNNTLEKDFLPTQSTSKQDDILDSINVSINNALQNMRCPQISNDYVHKNSIPPLADCPACVCPKVVLNTSEIEQCKAVCPSVQPCPDTKCPPCDSYTCPESECTYLGVKGIDNPDELFSVITDMLKTNKCTKETLIHGINNIFNNQ